MEIPPLVLRTRSGRHALDCILGRDGKWNAGSRCVTRQKQNAFHRVTPDHLTFFSFLAARFSFMVLAGFFLVSFLVSFDFPTGVLLLRFKIKYSESD